MQCELLEAETHDKFVKQAADVLEKQIGSVLAKAGRCVMGLSGGKTPLPVYAALAERPLEWQNVWVFLVDERYVSPDREESNRRAIEESLLKKVGHPTEQFLAPDTWKALPECVNGYENALKELFAKGQPDIITLGMGEDGHIASLFPPLPPEAFEPSRLAIATHNGNDAVPDRISVTIPVLTSAAMPLFLLEGRLKKRTWAKVLESGLNTREWPAHAVMATERAVVVAGWASAEEGT
ncbi:MAG: 6-phosphogluconolactonase [Candidatus Peribacteraceae bacterium]|jgi:6-phosphogluconolactonase